MRKHPVHFVFSGGGTAGHLFPGLAVAERLAEEIANVRITFAGSGKDFEQKHVAAAGFDYLALPCHPLPGKAGEAVSFVVENLAGYFAARRFLKEESVDLVVGLGGYASVPMGRAAVRQKVPLVLLEQNVVPGRATQWLSKKADLICTSFAETEAYLSGRCTIRCTGNPVRRDFVNVASELEEEQRIRYGRWDRPATVTRQLLVLGGSGGARSLNENLPRAFYKLREPLIGWNIVHQTGESNVEATKSLYRKLAIDAEVRSFFTDLPQKLSKTDLVVCRAGGTTLAELASQGTPAVLIPYPFAKDDHQRKNAEVFVSAGGAMMVEEPSLPGRLHDVLADVLSQLLPNQQRRQIMATAMFHQARPLASGGVAELLWSSVCSRSWSNTPAFA